MWKDIPNWENYYEINELGEVRNKITKKLIIGEILIMQVIQEFIYIIKIIL